MGDNFSFTLNFVPHVRFLKENVWKHVYRNLSYKEEEIRSGVHHLNCRQYEEGEIIRKKAGETKTRMEAGS